MVRIMNRLFKELCRRIGLVDKMPVVKLVRVGFSEGKSLSGKNILVTGGGSGIGLEIARRCCESGAKVIISGRNMEKLKRAVASMNEASNINFYVWDLCNLTTIERNLDDVEKLLGGPLDILINNAGIANRENFGSITMEEWDLTFRTNLMAPVFLDQALCNRWIKCGRQGCILNISSFAGLFAVDDAYSCSKLALSAFTKGMAKAFADKGIRINAIAPGVICGTDINRPQSKISPEGNLYLGWVPARRYGTPREIAEIALFLVSDAASYIHGQTITVDGGGALR